MSFTISLRSIVLFIAGVITAVVLVWVFHGVRADAEGGDSATFVAIEPCRLRDTRPNKGIGGRTTPLGASEAYTVQGTGPSGECDIPAGAVGLVTNVTAVLPTAATDLRLYPTGASVPGTSNLNPAPGQPPTPNAVTVGLSAGGQFDILNKFGDVHVIIDVNGYFVNASLDELAARLAAAEADIAANTAGVAALDAAQPFTVASGPVYFADALSTPTEIRSVTVQAPVAGHVSVIASGFMAESADGQTVKCGLLDSVIEPPQNIEVRWDSPTGGDRSHLSASRVFDIAAEATATYSLVCLNDSGGSSTIFSPQVTAIFTPAP